MDTTTNDISPWLDSGVVLSWSAPSNWGDNSVNSANRAFIVYRESTDISGLLSASTLSFEDTTGVNNTFYFYHVDAINGCGILSSYNGMQAIDMVGAYDWARIYGGSSSDYANSIQQTSDGGFIVAGSTVSLSSGYTDFLVMKLDSSGNISWQKTYGALGSDWVKSIKQTNDGGYIIAGGTDYLSKNNEDVWVLKLNQYGIIDFSCSLTATTTINPEIASAISSIAAAMTLSPNFISEGTSIIGANSTTTDALICSSQFIALQPWGGLKPHVDDSGSPMQNGIIEPDEAVVLLGNLQNIGTMDAFNTIGNLTSPDPIIITQPDAFYGIIPAGENTLCTTCYSITAPSANRTDTHWDFNAIEEISSDNYGPVSFDYVYHVGESFSEGPTTSLFYRYIETLLHSEATGGCTSSTYCPKGYVTRQQMAKFLVNAFALTL
jgi:hypothetical protein